MNKAFGPMDHPKDKVLVDLVPYITALTYLPNHTILLDLVENHSLFSTIFNVVLRV